MIKCALKYDIVVRLKGGDPFVFGRGSEEIQALRQSGVPFEVVPGVTSAVAVPECAGIPVTHRGVARSFHVIAGHTRDSVGGPDYDYELLGKLEGTLVFLMGLSNLEEITKNLLCAGKAKDTPTAVISRGTTDGQKTVRGALGSIVEKVKESKLSSPAVIVIGETAAYEFLPDIPAPGPMEKKPADIPAPGPMKKKLAGITATLPLEKKLAAGLKKMGMQPLPLCRMKIQPTGEMQRLGRELHHLDRYGWILFTSQNAVPLFFRQMKEQGADIRALGGLRFAALGSGTAERLLEYGIKADFIPSQYSASVLGEEFSGIVNVEERVLIPRARQGSKELTDILERKKINFLDLGIYDVAGSMTNHLSFLEKLDYLIFVSGSGVTAFFDGLAQRGLSLPKKIRIACIGRITEKRLLERSKRPADVVAATADVEGLLQEIERAEGRLSG